MTTRVTPNLPSGEIPKPKPSGGRPAALAFTASLLDRVDLSARTQATSLRPVESSLDAESARQLARAASGLIATRPTLAARAQANSDGATVVGMLQ